MGQLENTFPSSSYEDWKSAAEKLMKGKSLDQLVWHYDPNLPLDIYYDKKFTEDYAPISIDAHGTGLGCRLIEPLSLNTSTNEYAKKALNFGSEGVFLKNNTNLKGSQSFNEILPEHCIFMVQDNTFKPENIDAYQAFFTDRGTPLESFHGGVFFSLTEGELPDSSSFKSHFKSISYAIKKFEAYPNIRTILLDLTPIHLKGVLVVNELGYYLALLKSLLDAYLLNFSTTEGFLKNLQIKVSVGTDFYHEIAKLRAIRLLAFKICSYYNIPVKLESLSIVAETSLTTDTGLDRHSNYLRKTTQSMASMLGGADYLIINPMEARGYDPIARRVSRNIGNLLRDESFLNKVQDPLHGSYYVEYLTQMLAEKGWDRFNQIESKGGLLGALENGIVKEWITEDIDFVSNAINSRKRIIIGINNFPNNMEIDSISLPEHPETPYFRPSGHIEKLVYELEKALQAGTLKSRPVIQPVLIGNNPSMQSARLNFTLNFLGCGGFLQQKPIHVDSVDKIGSNNILVFCGADEDYLTIDKKIIGQFAGRSNLLMLAGYPKTDIDRLQALGIDYFIHMKSNIYETLRSIFNRLGVIKDEEKFNKI